MRDGKHEIRSHFDISIECFLRLFLVINASVIELVDMIFCHLRKTWLINHPKINKNLVDISMIFDFPHTIDKVLQFHRVFLLATAMLQDDLCTDENILLSLFGLKYPKERM